MNEYDSFLAEFYDAVAIYRTRADLAFYVEEARAAAQAAPAGITPVLELGCGTGRILVPAAEAGVRITGLDASAKMLAACEAKLAAASREVRERVRLVHGGMTDFHLGARFQLITAPFRPIQHLLTVDAQLACLACVGEHLAPGGRFIFDVFHVRPEVFYDPAWKEEKEDTPATPLPDGRSFRRTSRVVEVSRAEQTSLIEMHYYVTHPDGRAEHLTQQFPMRFFYRYELEHLLARAGFRVDALYGDLQRGGFVNESPEMIFVAERDV
jgi:SAM-dependent methyltransferase